MKRSHFLCLGFTTFALITMALDGYAQSPVLPPSPQDYLRYALSHEGDPMRGKELFTSDQRLACLTCHTIDGSSQNAGPDLFSVGDKFPRRDLIRAILEPSIEIAVGFATTTIITRSGDEHQGVLKESSPDALLLTTANAQSIRILRSDIRNQSSSPVSLMPEGLHASLSREEFTDLIEYLVTLKQPENALTSNRGLPRQIPELTKPIALRPFISEDLQFSHAFVVKPGDIRYGLTTFNQIPGRPHHFLVGQQTGMVWLLEKNPNGDQKTLFGDFSSELFNQRGPNGLLGLAFHPDFRSNRKYYLKHQVFEDNQIATVVVEKQAAPGFNTDSGEPSRRLLKIISATQDHSGGCIQFGPDGYLYIGMGDTGPQQDPQGHGQDLGTLLGKMIRIDVNQPSPSRPYTIPSDNPFLNTPGALPEIWALGFREPWRFSFDTLTGDLWVGDVGQDRVEEIAIVRSGENHGWNVMEGFEPFSNRYRKEGILYTPPVFAYLRKYGNSITGGYVYRGDPQSSFYGTYICGDYTSRRIWALTQKDRKLQSIRQIAVSPQGIASFGTDEKGNIYLVGYEGMIYQLDFSETQFETNTVTWQRHSFPLPESIWSVESLDANSDGHPDLIAMGEKSVFALIAPDWKWQVLHDTKEPKLLYCVALDADSDGDLDLALGRYRQPWIQYRAALQTNPAAPQPIGPDFSLAWLKNTGNPHTEWPLQKIDNEFNGIHGLTTGDVNRDGHLDLLADSIIGPHFEKSLGWFAPPNTSASPFKRHLITHGGADGRPHYLDFADINGDGLGDLLVGDSGGGTFTWWEQPTDPNQTWKKHLIASEPGATNIKAVDLNQDGHLDILASCGHGIGVYWYEGPDWKKHIIDKDLRDVHALAWADFDTDGDPDIAVASFGEKRVRWYENNGTGQFEPHDIDTTNQQEAYDLKIADLNADGRPDLILAGRETRNAVWYQNRKGN